MSDTDDGVLPDKDYQPDLPTGTAPDRQRRIAWADDNPATIDGIIAGTLVALPVEATAAMRRAGGDEVVRQYTQSDADEAKELVEQLDEAAIYRAMIAEHGRGRGQDAP